MRIPALARWFLALALLGCGGPTCGAEPIEPGQLTDSEIETILGAVRSRDNAMAAADAALETVFARNPLWRGELTPTERWQDRSASGDAIVLTYRKGDTPYLYRFRADGTWGWQKVDDGGSALLVIVLLIVWLPGAILPIMTIRQAGLALAAQRWPTVNGIVRRSEVSESFERRANATRYTPVVEYEYQVSGTGYSGSVLRIIGTTGRETEALAQTSARPVGSEVTVYYDPEEPGRSCLVPGVRWFVWLGVVIPPVFAGIVSAVAPVALAG